MTMKRIPLVAALAAAAVACALAPARAQQAPNKIFTEVGLDQKLGAWVPRDVTFRDEQGQTVTLGSFLTTRPVILALVYYDCPMICTEVLNGMVKSIQNLNLDIGKDYEVVTVSINPREGPPLAASKKASYVKALDRPGGAGAWHFLTGDDPQIKKLAAAVGFRYVYDEATGQYAHPTGIMVLTPQGQLARYLYGVEYAPKDLQFALIQASHNTVGSPVDQFLLLCYKYDPMTGKYGLVLWNLLRIGGALTLLAVGGIVTFFLVRERRVRRRNEAVTHS